MNPTRVDAPHPAMAIDVPSPSAHPPHPSLHRLESFGRKAALPLATALAYALAAKLGAWLAFPSAPVSALWAPNAILLAALVLAPRERWWAYLLAVLPFHVLAQLPDTPFAQMAIQFAGNAGEAAVGAWSIRILGPPAPHFDRLRPVLVLIFLAGLAAPLATSVVMVGAFALAGIPGDFWLTVSVRTLTNTFAIVALVPLILHVALAVRDRPRQVPVLQVVEGAFLALALVIVSGYVFTAPAESAPRSVAWLFAPLPLLAWATIRFTVPGACAASLLVGAISALGVLQGRGPFDIADPVENALSLVAFHVLLSVTLVLCAALLAEWRHATRELASNEARLRMLVEHNLSAEAGRKRAESLHAAVLGSVHDQIAVLDGAGTIIEVNDSWRRGVETAHPARFDRVLGSGSYLDACRRAAQGGEHGAVEHLAALESILGGRESRWQHEYLEPAGMEPAWIEVSIETLRRPEGGAVVTRTEVTARKRAEQEAQQQRQQLTLLGRAAVLGQLSGAFAHELNQPLTSILGNAEAALKLVEGGAADLAELREILQDIVQDDVRAAQVIDRLRALLERGDLQRRPVDLNLTVREVLELARTELLARHVRVTADLDSAVPAVMADRVQMQQIVLNLLMNACEAMSGLPAGERRLRLATRFRTEDSCVEVTMSDCGCGIPPGELERIFQPFVTTKPAGMGMGLAICRSVAEAHQGRLWAESGPAGATFHLRVPVGGGLA
jgi:C4-dicarboxylate-specific signal transduction histidine kinase